MIGNVCSQPLTVENPPRLERSSHPSPLTAAPLPHPPTQGRGGRGAGRRRPPASFSALLRSLASRRTLVRRRDAGADVPVCLVEMEGFSALERVWGLRGGRCPPKGGRAPSMSIRKEGRSPRSYWVYPFLLVLAFTFVRPPPLFFFRIVRGGSQGGDLSKGLPLPFRHSEEYSTGYN
jgi:hypothetical protein